MDYLEEDLFYHDYQNEREKTVYEFIFSYYYSYLKSTGPQDIDDLETVWLGQKDIFDLGPNELAHGICNFLLSSEKFTILDGKVAIVEDIDWNKSTFKQSSYKGSLEKSKSNTVSKEFHDDICASNTSVPEKKSGDVMAEASCNKNKFVSEFDNYDACASNISTPRNIEAFYNENVLASNFVNYDVHAPNISTPKKETENIIAETYNENKLVFEFDKLCVNNVQEEKFEKCSFAESIESDKIFFDLQKKEIENFYGAKPKKYNLKTDYRNLPSFPNNSNDTAASHRHQFLSEISQRPPEKIKNQATFSRKKDVNIHEVESKSRNQFQENIEEPLSISSVKLRSISDISTESEIIEERQRFQNFENHLPNSRNISFSSSSTTLTRNVPKNIKYQPIQYPIYLEYIRQPCPSQISFVQEIIKFNERNKSLIDFEDEQEILFSEIPKSISLKITSKLFIAHDTRPDYMCITLRPALEYLGPNAINKSVRFSGSYTFRCNIDLSENDINILSSLLKKHILLLDYQNSEISKFHVQSIERNFSSNQERASEAFENDSGISEPSEVTFPIRSPIMTQNTSSTYTADKFKVNLIPLDQTMLDRQQFPQIFNLKDQCIQQIQHFLADCEIQKKNLKERNQELQEQMLKLLRNNDDLRNKFHQQSINYLIFLKDLSDKQIKKFQDKCIYILNFLNDLKPILSSCTVPTAEKVDYLICEWKDRLVEAKRRLEALKLVFDTFCKKVICDQVFDLRTFEFLSTFAEPDILQLDIKNLICDNIMLRKQIVCDNLHIQLLQEYIYGPVFGVLKVPENKELLNAPTTSSSNIFPSGLKPKEYFEKQPSKSADCNVPSDGDCSDILPRSRTPDVKKQFKVSLGNVPAQKYTIDESKYEERLMSSITHLGKYIAGPHNYNHFDIIIKPDMCRKLSSLTPDELSIELSNLISKCDPDTQIEMKKKKLRFFDLYLKPITICFKVWNIKSKLETFIIIRTNFNIESGKCSDMETSMKKISSLKIAPRNEYDDVRFSDQSNIYACKTTAFPFKDDVSTSEDASYEPAERSTRRKRTSDRRKTYNKEICAICRDVFGKQEKSILKCGHFFHKQCIEMWMRKKKLCPVCREIIIIDEFPPIKVANRAV